MGNGINLQINFGYFMSFKEYDVIIRRPRQWLDVIDMNWISYDLIFRLIWTQIVRQWNGRATGNAERLGLGCHLVFRDGFGLCVDDGRFFTRPRFLTSKLNGIFSEQIAGRNVSASIIVIDWYHHRWMDISVAVKSGMEITFQPIHRRN